MRWHIWWPALTSRAVRRWPRGTEEGARRHTGLRRKSGSAAEVRRTPDRETDQTATWSLSLLQQALRRAPDGLPQVSTYTIWSVLRGAGWSWQKSRSWCDTGVAVRTRKTGVVQVTDPDATPKKS